MDIVSTRSCLFKLQDSLLTRFEEPSSFSAESFAKDIDTVITKLWNNQNTAQKSSEDLLKMYKITKRIFTKKQGEAIWEKLNPQSKSFIRIFHPYLTFPEFPVTQTDPDSLRIRVPSFFTFPDAQRFEVTLVAKNKEHYYTQYYERKSRSYFFFKLVDSPSKELIFYWQKDDFTFFDYREGLGISTGPKEAVSRKGHRVIRQVNNSRPRPLELWLKAKQNNVMLESVAKQITKIFHFEREFGVELYGSYVGMELGGSYGRLPFNILNGEILPKLDPSFVFLFERDSRHSSMIEICNKFNQYLGSRLIAQYKELKTGPNENIFNILKKAHSYGFISNEDLQKTDSNEDLQKTDSNEDLQKTDSNEDLQKTDSNEDLQKTDSNEDLQKTNSMAYQIAYALQAAQEKIGDLIVIPWEKINSSQDLFIYLNFVIRSTTKREDLYAQLFTAAKKLIKNIFITKIRLEKGLLDRPNHLSQEHENFIHQDKNIRKDLTAILYAIIIIEYYSTKKTSIMGALYSLICEASSNKNTSLDGFLDDLLEEIKKHLNEDESLKMAGKQIGEDGRVKNYFYGPVQTPGDYFITLFRGKFHKKLRTLSEHKFAPNPLGDLACLRVLHAVASYEKEFIDMQLKKVLKDNYKKVSRQKLEKELISRLENFTDNP